MTASIHQACIVLGVEFKDLTLNIAKAAFRKRALEFHPDKHGGNIASGERMKEINGAWEMVKTYFGSSSTPPTPPPPPPAPPAPSSSASAACYYAAVYGDDHEGNGVTVGQMWTKKGGWKAVCAGCRAWLVSQGNNTFRGLDSNQPEHAPPPPPPPAPSASRVAKCSYAGTYGEHAANSDSVGTIKTNRGRKPVCDACRQWLEAAGNTTFWKHDADPDP